VDSACLREEEYRAFKKDYEQLLGKVIQSQNDISQYQGFRLLIVEASTQEGSYIDVLDEISTMTKSALKLPGMGFRYEVLRDERRFAQIATVMLGEIRLNEDLAKIFVS
jgi:hypothetical protein